MDIGSSKNPNQDVSEKVGVQKHPGSESRIEKVQGAAQSQQRNGIGHQMIETAMKQRRTKNTDQSIQISGIDSKLAQVES